jgi:hypothetical protein
MSKRHVAKSLEQSIPVSEQVPSSLEQNYSTTALGKRVVLFIGVPPFPLLT